MSTINSTELKPNETSGSYIVSYDFRGQDTDVLIVGKMSDGGMTVTNAFQGQEAHDLLDSLTTSKNPSQTKSTIVYDQRAAML